MRYFEDLLLGEKQALGSQAFDRDFIVSFAERFDRQPFHLSEEAGRGSLFGGLAASGWQTAATWMRLWVLHNDKLAAAGEPPEALGPSPGFQDLKWLRPVLAGDVVSYSSTMTEKRALVSRPEWGLASGIGEGTNQRDELVFSFNYHVFVRRRPA